MFEWAELGRPAVMGVVNVTPDSFSDGGRYTDPDAAVAHGLELAAAGADLLDVGGESTRPGAEGISAAEELDRVLPVVARLAAEAGVPVSVDTTKSPVVAAALDAGAVVVNDVSAGRADPAVMPIVAAAGAGFVAMHMRGEPRTMQDDPRYDDVVLDVEAFLARRLAEARTAGIAPERLAADPGIGFGKTVTHNLVLLGALRRLRERLDAPLVVGTSRKRFIGAVLRSVGESDAEPDPTEREEGTLATVAWAVEHGADVVRVHDVGPSARVAALARRIAA